MKGLIIRPETRSDHRAVEEPTPGAPAGHSWVYRGSPAYEVDPGGFGVFRATFPPREKLWRPSQEEFYIYSHSALQ